MKTAAEYLALIPKISDAQKASLASRGYTVDRLNTSEQTGYFWRQAADWLGETPLETEDQAWVAAFIARHSLLNRRGLSDAFTEPGSDGECPQFPISTWRAEVAEGIIVCSYWGWLAEIFDMLYEEVSL